MSKGKQLARVERAEAFRLAGPLGAGVISIHGTKPTPFHRVDLVQMEINTPTFAAVCYQDGDFTIQRETPYTYTETFAIGNAEEVVILCKDASGAEKDLKVPVGRLESNSLRRRLETSAQPTLGGDPRALAPSIPRALVRSRGLERMGPDGGGPLPRPQPRPGSGARRTDGDFGASVSFYDVGYAACQAFVEYEDGERWTFKGQGGGAPGFGGYTGIINTNDLDKLIHTTTSCAIEGWTFYGTIQFFDAYANVLGWFHGGGFGIGAGGYAGHWERG